MGNSLSRTVYSLALGKCWPSCMHLMVDEASSYIALVVGQWTFMTALMATRVCTCSR